jgi:Mg2+ and Co2+ transporter CorA
MQSNLAAMQDIAMQNHRENEILGRIAKQTQKDSTALKTLTLIATIYLPATFIAV